MTTRIHLAAVLALGLWACGVDDTRPGSVGVVASALTSTCETGDAPQGLDRVKIVVTGLKQVEDESGNLAWKTRELGDPVSADIDKSGTGTGGEWSQDVVVKGVDAGIDRTLTILGYTSGQDTPTWFGRRREVSVTQDRTTEVELVLTRFGRFTCLDAPSAFSQRAFPASVVLGDGRVLLSGGFTGNADIGGGSFELRDPSASAFVYDPANGSIVQVGDMTVARAGHAMVYLPLADGEKVLVFGGATKMTVKGGSEFPLDVDAAATLDSFEIFDVATLAFLPAGQDYAGKDKKMGRGRVFPSVGRLSDNSILITGGGRWPLAASDYTLAEIWAPYADKDANGENPRGGMLDVGTGLVLLRQHNGAAMVKLDETTQGLSRYLVIGGTTGADANVEIFKQASKPEDGVVGAFQARSASGLPLLFFPTVTPLKQDAEGRKRFLVVGGAEYKSARLSAPLAKAWILSVDAQDKVAVEAIDTPCAARFLHKTIGSFDADGAVVLGGFTDFGQVANGNACFFDLATKTFSMVPQGQPEFFARAANVAERLIDDSLLLAGGLVNVSDLDGTPGLLELYTPPSLKTNLAE